MGSFYSHHYRKTSQSDEDGCAHDHDDDRDDKKENLPEGSLTSSPLFPGVSSDIELDKTPQNTGTGGLVCDPRSPNPEISRTPISVTQGKDTSVNPLKGKGKILGFTKQNSAVE